MITMQVHPMQTGGRTDGQTDEHHGNSATIRSSKPIAHQKQKQQNERMEERKNNCDKKHYVFLCGDKTIRHDAIHANV